MNRQKKNVKNDNAKNSGARVKPGMYVLARSARAGVFAGTLAWRSGQEAELTDARRIWYWAGAASLSQLAVDGTSSPGECKFPAPVGRVLLLEVIEVLPVTPKARASIGAVAVWKA